MRSGLRTVFVLLMIVALATVFLALVYRPPRQQGITEPAREYFDLTLSASGIEPNVISVRLGTLVSLNLTSLDYDYWFSLPGYGISERVFAGQTRHPPGFIANRVGNFTFQSTAFSGAIFTNEGTLRVT